MPDSRIQAVDHVHIHAQVADRQRLRWFYTEVAQLDEMEPTGRPVDRLCFKSERIELRIQLMGDPHIDGVGVVVTIAVASLEQVEELLRENRMFVEKISGLHWTNIRLHTLDPSGNRVELIKQPHWAPF